MDLQITNQFGTSQEFCSDREPNLNFRSFPTCRESASFCLITIRKYLVYVYILYLQEHSLKATQYIPNIVSLQQFMFDMFDRRLDKSQAETMTIRSFLREVKSIKNGMTM